MKKITFTFCVFMMGIVLGNAQEFDNLKDYIDAGGIPVINSNSIEQQRTVYTRNTEQTTLFTAEIEFEAQCIVDALFVEDFAGGPDAILSCSVVSNSNGDACFPAGELVEGFEITTSGAGIGNFTLYVDPTDGFGTLDPAVGSNTFADFTIINFTGTEDVTSFSFDLYSLLNGSTVTMRIFNADGEMETVDIDVSNLGPVFVGGISDTPITSIELEDLTGVEAELIANLRFGSCGAILTDEPEDAIALTVGEVFEDFPRNVDNTEATASEEAAPACGDFQGGDSWYTVTVPISGNVIIETGNVDGSAVDDTVLAIYSGAVDALVEEACDESSSATPDFSLITLMGRTPGEVLFVRVFESGNDVQGLYQIAAYSDCAVSAPEIVLASADLLEIDVCVGDGIEDFVDVTTSGGLDIGVEGWIIADNATGTIIGLPAGPPFEFDGLDAGQCAIYNIRYNDGLVGLEMNGTLDNLDGCFELSNPIIVNRVSDGGVCDNCEFMLELNDSFGDGWDGAEIDVLVDGIVALDNVTLAAGGQGIETFLNIDGAEISVIVEAPGTFPGEVSYRILNNIGVEVAVGDLTTVPDPFMGVCVDCSLPEVSTEIVLSCDDDQFSVTLTTVSLSDSSQLVVTNSINDQEIVITEAGSLEYGPFPIDSGDFAITVTPDDTDCIMTIDLSTPSCPPVNDDCMNAIEVVSGDVINATTAGATVDVAGCNTPDTALGVWYFINDGGDDLDVTIDTFGSSFDTVLAYFTGTCDALVCGGDNDDTGGTLQSEIIFNTGGTGENIYILATGFGTNTGDLVMNVVTEAAPTCVVPEVETEFVLLCDDDQFSVTLTTVSLSDSSQLVVTNSIDDQEIIVTEAGSLEYGPFPIDSGDFTITVTPDDTDCIVTIDLSSPICLPPAPVNDDCSGALPLSDGVTVTASTISATVDVAGCDTADTALGIWYFINDGGDDLDVTIDTFGSSFDTELSYFTGTCDALVCGGNNDDAGGTLQSEITFNTGGTGENIYILATGFGANTGDLVVNVTSDGLLSTGEETFLDNDITLFPNPAVNDLTISSREVIEDVRVYNISGQVVLEKSVNTTDDLLDVSRLTSGIYLMQITSNGTSVTKKFIKR